MEICDKMILKINFGNFNKLWNTFELDQRKKFVNMFFSKDKFRY